MTREEIHHMRPPELLLHIIVGCCAVVLNGCMGGSSETGNARTATITGSLSSAGKPASSAQVTLVKYDFIPEGDSADALFSTTTDSAGHYALYDIPWGSYFLNAESANKKLLAGPYTLDKSETDLNNDSLRPTARISIPVAADDSIDFVFIKGTTEPIPVKNGIAVISTAPAGSITIVGAVKNTFATTNPAPWIATKSLPVHSSPNDTLVLHFSGSTLSILNSVSSLTRTVPLESAVYTDTIFVNNALNLPLHFELITSPFGMQIDSVTGVIQWNFTPATTIATYRIGVKVSVPEGSADSIKWDLAITDTITAFPYLQLNIYPRVSAGDTVYASVNDTTLFTPDMRFRFFWGDGEFSDLFSFPSANHFYRDTGTFNVTLVITSSLDSTLLWSSDSVSVVVTSTIHRPPLPANCTEIALSTTPLFEQPLHDSISLFAPVWFRASLIGCESGQLPLLSISWGDNDTSDFTADTILQHLYVAPGNRTISIATQCIGGVDTTPLWYPVFTIAVSSDTLFDTSPPVISLTGGDTIIYFVNDTFFEPGYSARDDVDGNITSRVTIDSTVPAVTSGMVFTKPGRYVITYQAADSNNNVAIVYRTLIIIEP